MNLTYCDLISFWIVVIIGWLRGGLNLGDDDDMYDCRLAVLIDYDDVCIVRYV